jgi:capsular exopolysaccharide synthesis family protein
MLGKLVTLPKSSNLPPPAAFGGAAETLTAVTKALRKNWPTVLAVTLAAVAVGVVYAKAQPRVFQAETLIEISPNAPEPLSEDGKSMLNLGAGLAWDTHEYYETQYRILASNRVLGEVVRRLDLASNTAWAGLPSNAPRLTLEQATNALRGQVTIEPVKYSQLVHIRVDDRNPSRAVRISDTVAEVYIDQNLQTAVNASSESVVWLEVQLEHVKRDLEQGENALFEFKQRNDLPSTSINESSNMLRLEMQELDTALTHARTKKAEIGARAAELESVASDSPDALPASELLASPFLQAMRTQYQEAVKERSALVAEGKGDNHPLVKQATEKIEVTRSALLAEVRNIRGAVERDLAVVAREEQKEAELFEATRRRAVELNMKEIEYHRLDRTREENEKLYELLLQRMKEADLGRMMRVNNVRIVDRAAEPTVPVRPRISVIVVVSIFIGLIAGVGLAWVREQLDSSLKTQADVEQALGITFLGLLPEVAGADGKSARSRRRRRSAAPDQRPELVVHDRPLSGVAEAARSIRTNLMFMNPDQPLRRLLVTSAGPSEGKTTVACSLAIAFAQAGQRVCLVDADLRRPRLHHIFDRHGDPGLTNLLVGEIALDAVAKPTGIDNLSSVPAGPTPPNPADMLGSERFRLFLTELSERFDRIVIDSPPVVAVTDSVVLSTLVDGTVFVARAFLTARHLSAQGLRALRDVGAPVAGVVLNAVNVNRHEYSYYYYRYYRDGYRSSPPREAETPATA